jgi:hypothetical protein
MDFFIIPVDGAIGKGKSFGSQTFYRVSPGCPKGHEAHGCQRNKKRTGARKDKYPPADSGAIHKILSFGTQ